jgi:hypothetical protein
VLGELLLRFRMTQDEPVEILDDVVSVLLGEGPQTGEPLQIIGRDLEEFTTTLQLRLVEVEFSMKYSSGMANVPCRARD